LTNIPHGATSDWVLQEFSNSVEGIQLRPQLIEQETKLRFIRRYVNQYYGSFKFICAEFFIDHRQGLCAYLYLTETRPDFTIGLEWS
jgi:hypothetical protein